MKLYYAPQTRSTRARWLLEELEVPYELVLLNLSLGDQKKPEYLKIHPQGLVPALVDGDFQLFESAAICFYLAEKYPQKNFLFPAGSPERALCYQWVFFGMTSVEPLLMQYFLNTIRLPEEKRSAELAAAAREKLTPLIEILKSQLTGKTFLVGEKMSVADIIVGSALFWGSGMQMFVPDEVLAAYMQRLKDRPAYQRALAA